MAAEPRPAPRAADPACGPTPPTVTPHAPAAPRLIRQAELFRRMGVSKATGHRLLAAGKIGPRRIPLAGIRYHADEVDAWLLHRHPDGRLHDATTWPHVWATLRRRGGVS